MAIVDSQRLGQMFGEEAKQRGVGEQGVLFQRAKVLGEKDRLILELAFKNNLSVRQIGRILERPAGTISRKVNRICARLRDPMVAALVEEDCALSPQFKRIAIEYFAQGKRIEELARAHEVTPRQVRVMLSFVRGWFRGVKG